MKKLCDYYSVTNDLAYICATILNSSLKINYYKYEEWEEDIVEATINSFNTHYKNNYTDLTIQEDEELLQENNLIYEYFKKKHKKPF